MINYNSRTNEKSTTRTIRIPQKLDNLLEKDADNKRVSTNSLISSIITKYAEWDRYSELFQFVSLPPDMLKLFVESLDDEKIIEIGQQLALRHIQDMMFVYKKISLSTFFDALALSCRYGGTAKYEMEKTEERTFIITMHHNLGIKWSKFLQCSLDEGLKKTFKLNPEFNITETSVVFQFSVPLNSY
jgi:hypothetical protein